MCVYCNTGDFVFRHDPPWKIPQDFPYVPQPLIPQPAITEWGLTKLREYYELLRAIKELEEKMGCPCEPNKADYLKMFKDRIAELEKRL